MTIKQLRLSHKRLLAQFERAVVRRRKALKKAMKTQMRLRLTGSPKVKRAGRLVSNAMYSGIMNKVGDPKCKPYKKSASGVWYCNGCTLSRRRCLP